MGNIESCALLWKKAAYVVRLVYLSIVISIASHQASTILPNTLNNLPKATGDVS